MDAAILALTVSEPEHCLWSKGAGFFQCYPPPPERPLFRTGMRAGELGTMQCTLCFGPAPQPCRVVYRRGYSGRASLSKHPGSVPLNSGNGVGVIAAVESP